MMDLLRRVYTLNWVSTIRGEVHLARVLPLHEWTIDLLLRRLVYLEVGGAARRPDVGTRCVLCARLRLTGRAAKGGRGAVFLLPPSGSRPHNDGEVRVGPGSPRNDPMKSL